MRGNTSASEKIDKASGVYLQIRFSLDQALHDLYGLAG